jgi:hypothetical protein
MANNTSRPARDVTDATTNETHRLIASNKVEGTAVYTKDGDHIGSINNFMVDKLSGKVAYAVLSFGGFLGIGERYHPLPWEALTYHPDFGGYVVNVDRAHLENAPHYGPGENPWHDPKYGPAVYKHYGFPLHPDH